MLRAEVVLARERPSRRHAWRGEKLAQGVCGDVTGHSGDSAEPVPRRTALTAPPGVQMRDNPEVRQIPWEDNEEWLKAWENGQTGCGPASARVHPPTLPRAELCTRSRMRVQELSSVHAMSHGPHTGAALHAPREKRPRDTACAAPGGR